MCVCKRACVRGGGCMCAGVCFRACSLTNPARNASPYCHLLPRWLHHVFRHYLINGKIFGKTLLNIKCAFWFSLQLLFKTFLNLRIIQRDIVINVSVIKISMKLEFSWLVFEESSNIKFNQNLSVEIGMLHAEWRTERRADMKKLTVAFRSFANAHEKSSYKHTLK